MKKKLALVVLGSLVSAFQGLAVASQPLTFEQRVKAQEAIERVYYTHRIWPKENPQPKPPFEQMVPRAVLEAKVTDTLKKSAAVEEFWQRPITGEQLQAEMERMAKGTKDPARLRELLAALNNDPTLVAECVARPLLADRLSRSLYAKDERFHGETKAKAERALASAGGGSLSLYPEGNYQKLVRVLSASDDHAIGPQGKKELREITLDSRRFEKELQQSPDEGEPAVLRETQEAFVLSRTALKTSTRLEVETLVFPKREIGEWLKTFEPSVPIEAASPAGFAIPPMPQTNCTLDSWIATAVTNAPSVSDYSAVWTGTEMIVWGGEYYDGSWHYANTGGRYAPSTDTWTPTSTGANVPSARSGHAAVWTGTEMVVWGGFHFWNTGGRYNPSTDTWTATSTGANVPSARGYPTAVWTGTEMIVWGGEYYDSDWHWVNTGGRYNPSSDTWTPTSTGTNCPSARFSHTAVWTGTEMIVWGGYYREGTTEYYYNTGGRYNPSNDTWTLTSTGGSCPSARELHSAVWTGTQMIVWGGYYYDGIGSSYSLNTGARYTPSSNTWTQTSTGTNCPPARYWHSAAWTGTEMIVWGGANGGTNTGGRYTPSSNTWTPTSTGANCPAARYGHTAAWTATEMIVWGGKEYGSSWVPLATGGRYCVVSDLIFADGFESGG